MQSLPKHRVECAGCQQNPQGWWTAHLPIGQALLHADDVQEVESQGCGKARDLQQLALSGSERITQAWHSMRLPFPMQQA